MIWCRPWDREATHQLFDGLEFRVLRDRLLEALPNEDEVVPEGGFDVDAARLEPGELGSWLAEHAAGDRTGVDIIGHWASGAAMSQPFHWPPVMGRRRTSWSPTSDRLMRTRSRAGSLIPNGTRQCTTPKDLCSPSGPAVGISPA